MNLKTRTLLLCGAVAGPLFIVTFSIEGATRANYSALRHPVSSLALGSLGWMQVINFVVTGLLFIACALGLWRTLQPGRWKSLLIGLLGISLIGAGLFATDPVNGYPPGTPHLLTGSTSQGRIHDLFGVLTFLGLPITCLVFCFGFLRARKYGWAAYSVFSAATMLVFFVLAGMGFSQVPGYSDFAGVFQRLSIVGGFGWLTLLAIYFREERNIK
ncbi:MAG TPA: DUF998 domain-containing protein [Anaerolineales bacterium]|nr:DUF998 domain-containing protein [Anaerolineales bacterium]